MRKLILILMFGLVVGVTGCASDNETNADVATFDSLRNITLDHVDGSPAVGQISAATDVKFYMRLMNVSGFKAKGITNGFRIYSPDGATWTTCTGGTTGTLTGDDFDLVFSKKNFSVTGTEADTVGFGGAVMTGPGLADGFNDVAFSIAIGPIDASNVGKHVCIDSSYYPPSGGWKWAFGPEDEGGSHSPGWDGPHCFEVVQ
jgi:hypothetical protein